MTFPKVISKNKIKKLLEITENKNFWSKSFYVSLRQITELVKNIFYRTLLNMIPSSYDNFYVLAGNQY